MLIVHFGRDHETISAISRWFNLEFTDSWIDNPLAKEIILGIDNSIVKHPHVIESPVLGPITPRELSGGCKEVLLMAYSEDAATEWFFGGQLGDNTTPYILKVADTVSHDIHLQVRHNLLFPKGERFEFLVDNSNTLVHNYDEYIQQYYKYG